MTVARVALAILSGTCFILVSAAAAASVSGTIKDPQGRPVAGASVALYARMGATEQEVRTLRGIVATLAKGKGHARKPPT